MKAITIIAGLAATAGLAFADAEPGKAAPDFSGKTLDGKEMSLADLKDKTAVLEWVNFGCPYVKKHYSAGHMQKLQESYTAKGVTWILVASGNTADAGSLKKGAADNEVEVPILLDPSGDMGRAYGAKTTPHMFVLDEGTVAYAGGIDSVRSTKSEDIEKAENYVAAALDAVLADKEVATATAPAYGCSVKY